MKHKFTLLLLAATATMIGNSAAATVALGENLDLSFATGDTVTGDGVYSDGTNHTWTVDGAMTLGNGASNSGRLFVGVFTSSGILTLHGANGSGDFLTLNGYHSVDPVLGRLGHFNSGASAMLNITGGLAVSMGARNLKIGQGTNIINITDGSLDYSLAAFGFQQSDGGGSIGHVLGANGSLTIDAVITDAAGFTTWGAANGVDTSYGKIATVSAASGLTLAFANDGTNTTITAIPEPGSLVLLGLGGLALLRRRR